MLKLKWTYDEADRGRFAMLSLPFQLIRTTATEVRNVNSWGLNINTLMKILRTSDIKMPLCTHPSEWGIYITINNVYDYLERGCRYRSDSDYEAFTEILTKGAELGWIPNICIGTRLNDPRFARFPIFYVEDLEHTIYVWEEHNYHPELIPVAKEILNKLKEDTIMLCTDRINFVKEYINHWSEFEGCSLIKNGFKCWGCSAKFIEDGSNIRFGFYDPTRHKLAEYVLNTETGTAIMIYDERYVEDSNEYTGTLADILGGLIGSEEYFTLINKPVRHI